MASFKTLDVRKDIGLTNCSVNIQCGLTDSDTASITKVRIYDSGEIEFYWDYWNYGWYSLNELRPAGKKIAQKIIKKLKENEN